MKRLPSRELLDDDAGTPIEVTRSLADLRFLNRYFGGVATTKRMVELVAKVSGKSDFSSLEVAAGTGDLPQSVRASLQPCGIHLRSMLLDRRASHMGDGDPKVVGDALILPFRDASFDLVSCSLFVHHLAPDEVEMFVKEGLRCSRLAVLINDLIRHPANLATAYGGRLIYRSRLTRNDAPASVRQAYTTAEMQQMLHRSGAAHVEITRQFFYRMGAIAWKVLPSANGSARL